MKYVKILGLLVVSTAAVVAFAVPALATTLTSPTGTIATPTIKAESEGKVEVHALGFECDMSLEGTVESHGSEKPAVLPLSSLVQSNCGTWKGFTGTPGKLEITWTGGYNGTVTWTGGTIEWTPFPQLYCRYKSTGHFGTITGGAPAIIHINTWLAFEAGSAICMDRQLTGTLKVTSPSSLYVDA